MRTIGRPHQQTRWLAVLVGGLVTVAHGAGAAGPAFDCGKVEAGGIEALVCQDPALAETDRKLALVYAGVLAKTGNEQPPVLKAEQRGWIKGRDECWKAEDKRSCVAESYRLRTAELQARYRLLPPVGTATYLCDDQPRSEVTVAFFPTDPPTAIAERGNQVSFMVQQPAASGARYQGRNETLWEHQGKAAITWGYGSPELHCRVQR
jgi:uncharacterized protein